MGDNTIKNVQELIDKRTKNEIIIEASKEIKIGKKSMLQYAVSMLIAIIFSVLIAINKDTVVLYREIVDVLCTVSIEFLAIIFGSYAIFQALLSKELISLLIKANNNLLKDSNTSFINLIILFIGITLVNVVIIMALKIVPQDYVLLDNLQLANTVAGILIFIHLFISFLLLMEVINFAINLYRMFCTHNILKAMDSISDESEE